MKIKGLLLKNWYTLNKNIKILAVIFFLIWIAGIFVDAISLLFFYPCILSCVAMYGSWESDTRGWEKYALSLPCSEKEIVLSKYIPDICIKIVMIVLFVFLRGLRSVIFDVPFYAGFSMVLILAFYILSLCFLPLYIRFRWVLGILYFFIGAISGTIGIVFSKNENALLYEKMTTEIIILFCIFLCIIPISYYFSLRQYKKRDI